MRDIEQQRLALECLKLATDFSEPPGNVVARAEAYYAFVSGEDADDAKAKLGAVRNAIK